MYANQPVGIHTISRMVPSIFEIVGSEEKFTNYCLRATSLKSLQSAAKQQNWNLEDVKKISGHAQVKTITENYATGLDSDNRADMAMAILQSARIGRGEKFEPVSKFLRKRAHPQSTEYVPMDKVVDTHEAESSLNDSTNDPDFEQPTNGSDSSEDGGIEQSC